MAKIKKLLALGLCLCMAAGITVGCGDSKSSKNGTDSGKNTNDTVINELAKEGIAIIMVSSELPEIINMCDNVCVIRAGKLVGKLGKDQMNQEEIMKYAAGGVE